MPGFYAHYRFGRELISAMPPAQRQRVIRFRRLYDMGLYGPDVFGYFNPLMQTPTGELEGKYHSLSGGEFFGKALETAKTEGDMAYLYGVLAHYCLDSLCAGFVRRQLESGESLARMEAEFDRYLLGRDGQSLPYDLSQHMELTRGESVTVSAFYPPVTENQAYAALGRTRRFYHFLAGKNRKRVEKLLSLTGKRELKERLLPAELPRIMTRTTSDYLARYNRALKHYPALLEQLTEAKDKDHPLGSDFAPTFR